MEGLDMRRTSAVQFAATLGLALGCLAPLPALADAIDGAWCSPEGKHLNIKGRSITTPGGATLEGDYSRHAFSYVAPASEPGGGDTIYMRIVNDTTMLVRQGTPVAQPITWKRCETIS
jgi:hypothetical protein